eukprot:6184766-Pleurochrysis_carterae.AAC.1
MRCENILQAQTSAKVPVIARGTGQAILQCPESAPARATSTGTLYTTTTVNQNVISIVTLRCGCQRRGTIATKSRWGAEQ